ncbi:hypothetical protein EVA_11587 [gut metagenome]|uniref:Uncharacterized protein n=1 Tax=gut metagenome TaxID=749906 RepID=J9CJQ1_9ZZZZ
MRYQCCSIHQQRCNPLATICCLETIGNADLHHCMNIGTCRR